MTMRRLILVLAAASALTGCEKIDTLAVKARSERDVAMHLPSARCIDHLEIRTPQDSSTVLWQIERTPGKHSACPRDFHFPDAPEGYRITVSAGRLPKGSYAISGMAGDYAIVGHFDIPPR